MRISLIVLVAVVHAITLAASGEETSLVEEPVGFIGPYEDAPIETTFEANDAEVIFYANKHGVPIHRAIEIANWMEEVAPLLTELPELTDTFADMRIVHGGTDATPALPVGDLRIDISAKDPSDPHLRGIVAEIEELKAGSSEVEVTVVQVPRSLAELDELASAELAAQSPKSVEIDYDIANGTLIVGPVPEPEADSTWLSQCANVTGGSLDGGRKIRLDNDGSSGCQTEIRCTSGFPMRFNSAYGITTAGHCTDATFANYAASSTGFVTNYTDRDTDLYWVHQPNDIYLSANAYWYDGPAVGSNDDDVAFLRRVSSSSTHPGRIWKWDTGEWRNITGYETSFAPVGITVCAAASDASVNGASTYCGEVIDSVTNYAGGESGSLRWTEVDYTQGSFNKDKSGGAGSSGGTIFYAGFVYGMQSHASNCPSSGGSCTPARYYRVSGVMLAMGAVSSDVKFICYNAVFCNPS
ncbi:MAG: hypothetical protein ACRELV_07915 [Longimicrobiales bacterium]